MVRDPCHSRPELTQSAEGKGIQHNDHAAKPLLMEQHTASLRDKSPCWIPFPSALTRSGRG
jgi:hypothetical protein